MNKAVIALLVFLIACGPVGTGYIYTKDFHPSYYTYIPVKVDDITVDVPQYHSATYFLGLRIDGGNTAYCEVTVEVYNQVQVGQLFNCEKQVVVNKP